jgi:hypothetical protein
MASEAMLLLLPSTLVAASDVLIVAKDDLKSGFLASS